jgi:hypothetical protein
MSELREIPRISPTEGFITRSDEHILSSMLYQLQFGGIPEVETLVYNGTLLVQLANIPALDLILIQGYRNGNFVEFTIGTPSVPSDVYLDVATSELNWQTGLSPDVNSTYKVWYRYQGDSSTLRAQSPGSILRLLLESISFEFQHAYRFLEEIFNSGFIDTAVGLSLDYLTTIVLGTPYLYPDGTPTPRQQPSKSEGFITFYGSEGATISDDVVVTTDEESPRRYEPKNTPIPPIPVGSDSITVEFISIETGAIQNASVGLITVIEDEDKINGITSITNLTVFEQGSDLETDESLRNRAKSKFAEAGKGTIDAIRFALIAIPGVADAQVDDFTTIRSIERGNVNIMIVGDSIPISKGSALWTTIIETVDESKGAGIAPLISQPYIINVSLVAEIKTATFTTDNSALITKINSYINGLAVGGDVIYYQLLKLAQTLPNITDFTIHRFTFTNASNFGAGGSADRDPTPDFAEQWWNSGIHNNTQQNSVTITISDTEYIAQVFTPTNEWLSGITLFRKNDSSGSGGDRIIEIWEVDGTDEPQQKVRGSSTYAQITVLETDWEGASFADESANLQFPVPVHLDTTKNYAIIVYKTGVTDDTSLMDATDSANDTRTSADSGASWTANLDTHDLQYVLHFSGEYKSAQSFTFRTNIVKFERRTVKSTVSHPATVELDAITETKTPVETTAFLGIWRAIDLDGDGIAETPHLSDLLNYASKPSSQIDPNGDVQFDTEAGDTFNQGEEFLVTYEYYQFLENFKGVKVWLKEEQLYENSFDGQVILQIREDNSGVPSDNLLCRNQIDYCLVFDASETGDKQYREETRDINDADVGDVTVEISAGDFLYIGADDPFYALHLVMEGVTQTTGTIVVKYWNGSAWAEFEFLVDNTISGGVSLEQDGQIRWFFPSDWAKNVVKDINAYWIQIDATALDASPTISTGYLSFAEKILTSTDLALTTAFVKKYFEFDRALELTQAVISDVFWIVIQAVGQKNGRIVLLTDDVGNNFDGETKDWNGTNWTTRLHEQLTVVTEEEATATSGQVSVANQANLEPTSDALVIDVMDATDNDKSAGAGSLYHEPGDSGDFTTSIINLSTSQSGFSGDVLVTYLYDANLSSNTHVDWIFEIIIEKLIDPTDSSPTIEPNIIIEDQRSIPEKSLSDEIVITEMN